MCPRWCMCLRKVVILLTRDWVTPLSLSRSGSVGWRPPRFPSWTAAVRSSILKPNSPFPRGAFFFSVPHAHCDTQCGEGHPSTGINGPTEDGQVLVRGPPHARPHDGAEVEFQKGNSTLNKWGLLQSSWGMTVLQKHGARPPHAIAAGRETSFSVSPVLVPDQPL